MGLIGVPHSKAKKYKDFLCCEVDAGVTTPLDLHSASLAYCAFRALCL